VGRPSTYASIIATVQDRGYVWKKGTALVPSFTAFAVVTLLERHFPELVDYAFTARMEDDLDEIAGGSEEMVPWLTRFYFGHNGDAGLKSLVSEHLDEIDARDVNSIFLGPDPEGVDVVARVGRYGPYLQRGEDTARIPEDLAPDELTVERAQELLEAPSGDRTLGTDPETGLPVIARAGRFGPYVQLGDPAEGGERPRTASLLSTMDLGTVALDDALRLLSLPRVVGVDPADGQEIVALNGRYGPYLKKGDDTRSLDSEEQLFTVDLDTALRLFAEPKRGRAQRAASAPLRELGSDPASGGPVVVKEGRFGPYVTDGETNASLRKGDTVDGITVERAAELLEDRRAKLASTPGKKKATKKNKATKKKAAPKKQGARKKKAAARRSGGAAPSA
jgi:DNA topoisomerase-1